MEQISQNTVFELASIFLITYVLYAAYIFLFSIWISIV